MQTVLRFPSWRNKKVKFTMCRGSLACASPQLDPAGTMSQFLNPEAVLDAILGVGIGQSVVPCGREKRVEWPPINWEEFGPVLAHLERSASPADSEIATTLKNLDCVGKQP
jgi:hypothetical protein